MDGFISGRENKKQLNVLGGVLEPCDYDLHKDKNIVTGFYRDNCCNTGYDDHGLHTVCCLITEDFLIYSKSVDNDLSTPIPEYNFFGLSEGVSWCLCAARWKEAYEAGEAPKVFLKSTNIATLSLVELDHLKEYAVE